MPQFSPLYRLLLFPLFIAVGSTIYAQAPSSCAQALYFYQLRQFSQALTLYDQCLMDHPTDGVMYYNRGKTWYELGYIDKALVDFEEAIKLTPSFVQSYYALSEHFLSKKDELNALKWMNELLMRYPDLAAAHNLRGWIYFNFNRTQLAFTDFDKAITLDSLNASAYNNRGSARYQLQDIESASTSDLLLARADFMKALKLDSSLANLHRNLGFIEFSLGHYPIADSLLHVAEMRNPNDAMVYYYHGLLYSKTNKTDAAIVEMDKALKQYANLGIAWLAKGQLQFDKRRYADAVESFNAAARTEPTLEPATAYQLAKTYAAQFERELMLEQLKLADKLGFFGKLSNKQAFFSEPVFQNYGKWAPFKAFEKKVRGI
jgi:tetratricopeptide (TPR) repeat protein